MEPSVATAMVAMIREIVRMADAYENGEASEAEILQAFDDMQARVSAASQGWRNS